jgi:hypothetical protein
LHTLSIFAQFVHYNIPHANPRPRVTGADPENDAGANWVHGCGHSPNAHPDRGNIERDIEMSFA